MARKKRGPGKGREPRRRHLRSMPTMSERADPSGPEDQELIRGLRSSLRADGPVPFLEAMSAVMTATDTRTRSPFDRDVDDRLTLPQLLDTFVEIDLAETTAALRAAGVLSPDEVLAARSRKAAEARRQPMPPWLAVLDVVTITGTRILTHVLGDGDDYLIGAALPTGDAFTALVYIDHNIGSIVKDAFVVPEGVDDLVARMEELITDPDQKFEDAEPALARAVVTQAIDWGAMTFPQPESETWPQCRPLVEWLVRQLPEGGVVPERHEWTEGERRALGEEFFGSSYGRGLDGADERELLDDLIWFGTGWGSGNPLRWSPVNVEILLDDWIPRKIVADTAYLTKAPDLLRAFIRFGHVREEIRDELTEETLAAVDHWEPEYQRLIRTSRPQGAEALARMMIDAGSDWEDGYDDDRSLEEIMLESLDRAVGGRSSLLALDDEPLPDEQFEWAGIAEDIRPRVEEVLQLCDACADELLDVEHRTAMRRFLGRAAVGDAALFRRKARSDRGAAAVAWVIARANGTIGYSSRLRSAKDLFAWFGVEGSVSQRAEPFLRANGVDPHRLPGGLDLGTPDLLVARRRARIIGLRDRYRSVD